MGSLWRRLSQLTKTRPLLTSCVTYGSIAGLAELTQQTVENKLVPAYKQTQQKGYQLEKVGHYVLVGSCLFSPVLYVWYRWLDRTFPGTTRKMVTTKLFLDTTVLEVPLYSLFYIVLNLLDGKDWTYTKQELRNKLIPTLLVGLLFWVPAQAFNFLYLAPHMRVVYIALCTYVEVNILCLLKRMDF